MADPIVEALAHRAREGDQQALHQLLARLDHDGTIRIAIRRLIFNTDDVNDLSQEVLLAITEKLHTWDTHRRFTTWVRGIARNKAIDHLRRLPRPDPLPADLTVTGRPSMSSDIANRETLHAAIRQLTDPYRAAVVLRDIEELDYDEISRTLGIPESTARTHVARGRKILRAALAASRRDLR